MTPYGATNFRQSRFRFWLGTWRHQSITCIRGFVNSTLLNIIQWNCVQNQKNIHSRKFICKCKKIVHYVQASICWTPGASKGFQIWDNQYINVSLLTNHLFYRQICRLRIWSSLVKVTACRRLGANSLPEALPMYCQLNPPKQYSLKSEWKHNNFVYENTLKNAISSHV